MGKRIMFHSFDEIRILKNDALDIILKLNDDGKGKISISISSFVAVDNFDPNCHEDRHAFVEK